LHYYCLGYNGQLLEHVIALLSCSFGTLLYCYCFFEQNKWRDGDVKSHQVNWWILLMSSHSWWTG